jgi:hypothetical protein
VTFLIQYFELSQFKEETWLPAYLQQRENQVWKG